MVQIVILFTWITEPRVVDPVPSWEGGEGLVAHEVVKLSF